jgi:hypothetical protein
MKRRAFKSILEQALRLKPVLVFGDEVPWPADKIESVTWSHP